MLAHPDGLHAGGLNCNESMRPLSGWGGEGGGVSSAASQSLAQTCAPESDAIVVNSPAHRQSGAAGVVAAAPASPHVPQPARQQTPQPAPPGLLRAPQHAASTAGDAPSAAGDAPKLHGPSKEAVATAADDEHALDASGASEEAAGAEPTVRLRVYQASGGGREGGPLAEVAHVAIARATTIDDVHAAIALAIAEEHEGPVQLADLFAVHVGAVHVEAARGLLGGNPRDRAVAELLAREQLPTDSLARLVAAVEVLPYSRRAEFDVELELRPRGSRQRNEGRAGAGVLQRQATTTGHDSAGGDGAAVGAHGGEGGHDDEDERDDEAVEGEQDDESGEQGEADSGTSVYGGYLACLAEVRAAKAARSLAEAAASSASAAASHEPPRPHSLGPPASNQLPTRAPSRQLGRPSLPPPAPPRRSPSEELLALPDPPGGGAQRRRALVAAPAGAGHDGGSRSAEPPRSAPRGSAAGAAAIPSDASSSAPLPGSRDGAMGSDRAAQKRAAARSHYEEDAGEASEPDGRGGDDDEAGDSGGDDGDDVRAARRASAVLAGAHAAKRARLGHPSPPTSVAVDAEPAAAAAATSEAADDEPSSAAATGARSSGQQPPGPAPPPWHLQVAAKSKPPAPGPPAADNPSRHDGGGGARGGASDDEGGGGRGGGGGGGGGSGGGGGGGGGSGGGGSGRRARVAWLPEQVVALKMGASNHGEGSWAKMLRDPRLAPVLTRAGFERHNVDLKDKFRNVVLAAGGDRQRVLDDGALAWRLIKGCKPGTPLPTQAEINAARVQATVKGLQLAAAAGAGGR